jgi:hypothetical protein
MYDLSAAFHRNPVVIRFSCRKLFLQAKSLFRYFPSAGPSTESTSFSVVTDGEHSTITQTDGDEQRTPNDVALAVLRKKVTAHWIDEHPEYLWLHAGAVACEEQAVLFTGPSGSGKSTLTLRLAEAGWQYLCDDVLAIEPESLRVYPIPFPPQRRTTYVQSMSRSDFLFQEKAGGAAHLPLPPGEVARVHALFLIQYVDGLESDIACCTLAPIQAGSELLAQSFGARERHKQVIGKVMKLVQEAAPVRRLEFSDAKPVLDYLDRKFGRADDRGNQPREYP